MNPLVGAGERVEVRRPLTVFQRFHNFLYVVLVTFYGLLLVTVFGLLEFLKPEGARRLFFGPKMQWLPIIGSKCVSSGSSGRVKSKNLVTKCLIGKGSSGIFYETTWLGCSQGFPARLARKDFPGVKGETFEREVIPLFQLPDHPNLLKTLCWTVDSRSCSLVTEYMRDDLASVMRRKKELRKKQQANQPGIMGQMAAPFELLEALEIAIQIAVGMEYLHREGIPHGDLKANNIFIDWEKHKILVKLADFGLLQTKRRSTMVSQRAFCFQMLRWSAPELFEEHFRSASEDLEYLWTKSPIGLETSTSSVLTSEKSTEVSTTQADSYSFALICAFILGGQMWDVKLSPSELRRGISNSGLRPTLPSECPKTLRSLISLCWDANPTLRPTFSDILKSLREEQENLMKGGSASEGLRIVETKDSEEETLEDFVGTGHDLPSYLNIDLATVTVRYSNLKGPNMRLSQHNPVEGLHFGNWLGCDCAVKVFKAVDRSKYFMDLEALSKLHHPNIVQFLGFGQDEEKSVAVMELMDTDLRSFMRTLIPQGDRPFSLSQELDIITQIARGLYYLHEQRFSHGDLKSSKILVKQMGDHIVVKLTDFELSEKLGTWDSVSFKERSKLRGPRWSAPEIYSYGEMEPTHASLKKADVYSFGMVCFEVVTRKYCFHDFVGDALLEQIARGVLKQDLPSELNGDLRFLIESCWEDPHARPTLDMICHMLHSISSSLPVTSTRPENAVALSLVKGISIHEHQSLTGTSFAFSDYQVQDDKVLYEEYSNAARWPDCVDIDPANLKLSGPMGRFGGVYPGTWLLSNVAVKIFRISAGHRQMQNELNFYVKLRHPCIVQFMGISIHPKHVCAVVMELMGGNLQQLIKCRCEPREPVPGLDKQKTTLIRSRNLQEFIDLHELYKVTGPETVHDMPFHLREAVYIMRRIALGVAFMHSKGVAHRDLKPSNILVPRHPDSIDVKIADFGASRHIDSKDPLQDEGTILYMAPEVHLWRDKIKVVRDDESYDLKSADVYSFALTCYEILTGRNLFQDLGGFAPKLLRLRAIEGLRPTLPSDDLISADLRSLIEQCWDQKPEKRPTFSTICNKLQKIQQSLTTEQNLGDGVLKH